MKNVWVDVDIRDAVVRYIDTMQGKTEIPLNRLLRMAGIRKGKYFRWRNQTGGVRTHNCNLPKKNWLINTEREAIITYAKSHYANNSFHLRDGYRRLSYHMLNEDIVAVSWSSVHQIFMQEEQL